jgi:putative peptidoglycan lipid II flippase
MVASTIITVLSLYVYRSLFHAFSVTGLAVASDVGILANTVVAALLLQRRKLVELKGLPWGELAKAGVVAVVAGVLSFEVARVVPLRGSRAADLESLVLVTLTWAAAVAAGLWLSGSELPRSLRRRSATPPAVATAPGAAPESMEP